MAIERKILDRILVDQVTDLRRRRIGQLHSAADCPVLGVAGLEHDIHCHRLAYSQNDTLDAVLREAGNRGHQRVLPWRQCAEAVLAAS